MNESTPVRGGVVVGVDGSKASTDALRWAVRYARMAGSTVRVVTAWYFPATYGWAPTPLIAEVDLEADARLAQKQVLEEVVAGMLLGSVSEHCVHHAACPVVVVHHDGQPRWDDN